MLYFNCKSVLLVSVLQSWTADYGATQYFSLLKDNLESRLMQSSV